MPEPSLFQTNQDELLISVYARQGRTLDDLPYTPEFEAIHRAMVGDGGSDEPMGTLSRADLFHWLHNLRKAGRLPRMGRAASSPPRIAAEHEKLLVEMVTKCLGRISLRDRLPFTPQFDEILTAFNAQAGLNLTQHALWRIVAKLAK